MKTWHYLTALLPNWKKSHLLCQRHRIRSRILLLFLLEIPLLQITFVSLQLPKRSHRVIPIVDSTAYVFCSIMTAKKEKRENKRKYRVAPNQDTFICGGLAWWFNPPQISCKGCRVAIQFVCWGCNHLYDDQMQLVIPIYLRMFISRYCKR